MNIIEALISMGYRPMNKEKTAWGKPFGYTLLTFNKDAMEIKQLFWGVNDQLLVWDTNKISEENALDEIKQFEAYVISQGLECGNQLRHPFEFISQEQNIELILGL